MPKVRTKNRREGGNPNQAQRKSYINPAPAPVIDEETRAAYRDSVARVRESLDEYAVGDKTKIDALTLTDEVIQILAWTPSKVEKNFLVVDDDKTAHFLAKLKPPVDLDKIKQQADKAMRVLLGKEENRQTLAELFILLKTDVILGRPEIKQYLTLSEDQRINFIEQGLKNPIFGAETLKRAYKLGTEQERANLEASYPESVRDSHKNLLRLHLKSGKSFDGIHKLPEFKFTDVESSFNTALNRISLYPRTIDKVFDIIRAHNEDPNTLRPKDVQPKNLKDTLDKQGWFKKTKVIQR